MLAGLIERMPMREHVAIFGFAKIGVSEQRFACQQLLDGDQIIGLDGRGQLVAKFLRWYFLVHILGNQSSSQGMSRV